MYVLGDMYMPREELIIYVLGDFDLKCYLLAS